MRTAVTGMLAAALLLAGCSSADKDSGEAPAPEPAPVAKITVEPGAHASDVNPAVPISATVERGRFDEVTLTNADGKQVDGELSPDGTKWHTTEPLGFDKTYTWGGHATGGDGKQVEVHGDFSTVKPKETVRATVNPTDDAEVGIAMPISVKFDSPVEDKAAAERALKVDTSVPVEGAWAWLSSTQVDWRPKEYWPANTEVTVEANLYGVPYGGGAYGKSDLTTHFTIGRAQITRADVNSHRLVVERDGAQVASYPASFGAAGDPGRNTPNGTYVVMQKNPVEIMDNPRYGYTDVEKKWAVRISNHGEFIHENEENRGNIGSANTTHGCANLTEADAKKYFDSAMVGDPVEVTGSKTTMEPRYDVFDWMLSWDQWTAKSAL